jgi:hypothetical protein
MYSERRGSKSPFKMRRRRKGNHLSNEERELPSPKGESLNNFRNEKKNIIAQKGEKSNFSFK